MPHIPDPPPIPPLATPTAKPRRARITRWVLWTVFVVQVAGIVGMQYAERTQAATAPNAPGNPAAIASPFVKMVSKIAVGMGAQGAAGLSTTTKRQLLRELDQSAATGLDKLRAVPAVAWVGGGDEALARLDAAEAELFAKPPVDPDAARDIADFRRALTSGSSTLDQPTKDRIIQRHHWFGRVLVALDAPRGDPARDALVAGAARSVWFMIGAASVMVMALVAGIALLAVLLLRVGHRQLIICHPYDLSASAPTGLTLLETAIIFLAGFVIVRLITVGLERLTGLDLTPLVIWLLLLVALWPLARGVPWSRLKYALGWHKGRGVAREAIAGLVGYVAGLPIVFASFAAALVLMWLLDARPTHPVVEHMARQTPMDLIAMFTLGVLWAPVVEETIFRGALFHHLRRTTSAVLAALLVGFIFAIIHPQGIALVPPLMTLGAVFALIREWRGSLIGPMVAHATHNAFLMTMLAVLLS